jgi:hypothetical protein
MAPLKSNAPLRRSERGGVSWVTLLILASLATAGYLAVVWAPIYVVHYEVKQAVRDFMNQAIKNREDAFLVERMCMKIRSLDTTEVALPDGRVERRPSVDLQPDVVTWERNNDATPPTLRVAFEYTRVVRYPFLEKSTEWVGAVELEKEMVVPDWGPAR